MKRTAVLFMLLVFILISAQSYADVLTIDLEQATMEELLAARDAVDQAIAEKSKTDEYTIRGQGTETQTVDFVLPPLSRLVIKSNDSFVHCSYLTADGKEGSAWDGSGYFEDTISISQISVESKKPWILQVSVIEETDDPFISGHGNEISDRFSLPESKKINVTFDYTAGGGSLWNEKCSLTLFSVDEFGVVHPQYIVQSEIVYEGKTTSIDAVIQPDPFAVSYFWRVKCNNRISWTISELPADQ